MAASHTWPSWHSPSPSSANTVWGAPSSFRPAAAPAATDSPCPSEPVDTSTPGTWFESGWPCSRLPSLRSVASSSRGK